jgi:acyl-CoA synthetase (NDP forming)
LLSENINCLLYPESVAVAGASASPDKFGYRVLFNIINNGFQGRVYPVNPRESDVLGLECFPSVVDIEGKVDLAVITVPTAGVKQVLQDCIQKGVKAVIVITSGFSEVGGQGVALESEIAELAQRAGLAMAGPNCVGLVSTPAQLYCHMMPFYPSAGPIAIVAQSGSVADMIASRIRDQGLGVSHLISAGNEAVLRIADYLDYLADDEHVSAVVAYIEGIRDGRRFLQAAKRVTSRKPLIILKSGGTAAGARAALSHTAALAGDDRIITSLIRQSGAIRVDDLEALVDAAAAFNGQPLPRGNRVGIIAPGGGFGVMAADACARSGLDVAPLDRKTLDKLDSMLPPTWSHGNPVDTVAGVTGGAMEMVQALLESPAIDGLIVLSVVGGLQSIWKYIQVGNGRIITDGLTQGAVDYFDTYYRQIMELKERYGKPVVVTFSLPIEAEAITREAAKLTRETGTACYTTFSQAVRAYSALSDYAAYLRKIDANSGRA